MADGGKICEKGQRGVVLPLFGDWEQEWPQGLRVIMYLLGLSWCFMGVAMIADIFMNGIEKVTSKKVRLWDKKMQRFYTFEVWNATVANLTLMALGSSAPEILLNVIDIFAKEFFLEGLGPGTIVGSAAFNLLMIIAVCIVSIPNGQVRTIKDMPVYLCTAFFSLFAYLWLLAILILISPNVVEVWEGVVTFLLFPVLVALAFACDRGWIIKKSGAQRVRVHEDMSPDELAAAEEKVRAEHGENLSAEQVARILAVMNPMKQTRLQARAGVTAAFTGGRRPRSMEDVCDEKKRNFSLRHLSFLRKSVRVIPIAVAEDPPACTFEFTSERYAVLESAGHVTVKVKRSGDLSLPCRVWAECADGTAHSTKDYVHTEAWLVFGAGEDQQALKINVIDDDNYELDEEFYVVLAKPQVLLPGDANKQDVEQRSALGTVSRCTVVIIDDDEPGMLTFEKEELVVQQRPNDFEVPVVVKRKNGSCGKVSVNYLVEGDTGQAGRDFVGTSGVLVFENHQMEALLSVTIKGMIRYDGSTRFRVILSEPSGGVKLDNQRDGGTERNILTVTIEADPKTKQRVDHVQTLLQQRWQKSKISRANWAQQFKQAIQVNGLDDDDEDAGFEEPSKKDYIMHILALPWKLLFALVPPTDYGGGWVCFFCALGMIGLVTMLIGDMAALLGCTLCLPDDVTAITFVALGTSLPDTFASRTAAVQDPHADASVGNVTGSNSVNVFLGLGLPWAIASIYWATRSSSPEWQDRYSLREGLDFLGPAGSRSIGFVVEAGSLSFSVAVFSTCALVCLAILQIRRSRFGGELGGPHVPKWVSAISLVCLWLVYVGLSAWQSISSQGGLKCPVTR